MNDRYFSEPQRPGGLEPAVPRNNMPFWIRKDRICEAERIDRRFDLIDLAFRMGAGIPRIGYEVAYGR